MLQQLIKRKRMPKLINVEINVRYYKRHQGNSDNHNDRVKNGYYITHRLPKMYF